MKSVEQIIKEELPYMKICNNPKKANYKNARTSRSMNELKQKYFPDCVFNDQGKLIGKKG